MKAAIVATIEELENGGPGLIYRINHNTIAMNCPGYGNRSAMTVYREGEAKPPKPSWLMTGPPESITLHPSINCIGCCKWHGWLKNGEYKLA